MDEKESTEAGKMTPSKPEAPKQDRARKIAKDAWMSSGAEVDVEPFVGDLEEAIRAYGDERAGEEFRKHEDEALEHDRDRTAALTALAAEKECTDEALAKVKKQASELSVLRHGLGIDAYELDRTQLLAERNRAETELEATEKRIEELEAALATEKERAEKAEARVKRWEDEDAEAGHNCYHMQLRAESAEAEVARLKVLVEDCEREHPPEPEYLAWQQAGKPDAAKTEPVNWDVDGLTLPCGSCGNRVPFDVLIPDELWASIPKSLGLGVLCLTCIDQWLPNGLPPSAIRIVYATTSLGTVALLPVPALARAAGAKGGSE